MKEKGKRKDMSGGTWKLKCRDGKQDFDFY